MFYYDDDHDDHDLAELRAEAAAERRYRGLLARYPDCRDPDHPGCERCEPQEDESVEQEDEGVSHV
jgi:hypothetical protein